MRKFSLLLAVLLTLCLFIAFAVVACGGPSPEEAPPVPEEVTTRHTPSLEAPAEESVPDVDLTTLSSTMVYGEVASMMISPEDYVGKTIKARGEFTVLEDEESGENYYMLLIRDALACCAQGLEFYPTGGQQFPEDFPSFSTEIELTGVFSAYQEGDTTYYYIVCDNFSILE